MSSVTTEDDNKQSSNLPVKKVTLNDLLSQIQQVDMEMLKLPEQEARQLAKSLEIKVDGYKYMVDRFKQFSVYLAGERDSMNKARNVSLNKIKYLKKILQYHMEHFKYEMLPGERWYAKLIEKVKVEYHPDKEIPTATEYRKFPDLIKRVYSWNKQPDSALARKFPHLVDRSYEWDETAVRAYLKTGKKIPGLQLGKTKEVRFNTRSGGEK